MDIAFTKCDRSLVISPMLLTYLPTVLKKSQGKSKFKSQVNRTNRLGLGTGILCPESQLFYFLIIFFYFSLFIICSLSLLQLPLQGKITIFHVTIDFTMKNFFSDKSHELYLNKLKLRHLWNEFVNFHVQFFRGFLVPTPLFIRQIQQPGHLLLKQ